MSIKNLSLILCAVFISSMLAACDESDGTWKIAQKVAPESQQHSVYSH